METLTKLLTDLNITLIDSAIVLIVGSIFTGIGLFITIQDYKKLKKTLVLKNEEIEKLKEQNNKLSKDLTIEEVTKYVQLFDKIILDKINFYFFNHFLASYEKNKEISIKEIKEIKNQFYLDVSSALCVEQKAKLLKIFSPQGIEIYIHQTFLQKLNELDVKFRGGRSKEKDSELSASMMKEIYKG